MFKAYKLLKKHSTHRGPASFREILEVGDVNRLNMKSEAWYTNRRLQQFNCFKHKFTNYKDLVDLIYYGDYTAKQGVAILRHIYLQLAQCDIPEDYRPIVALAFRFSAAKYRRFCQEEQRLTQYDTGI
jgi:hypothetical protein